MRQQPTSSPPDWDALARYLAGESPDSEAEVIRAWLLQDPSRSALVHRLDQVTRNPIPDFPPVDAEAALRKVKARLGEPLVRELPVRRQTGWLLRLAAALVLVGGAALVWRLMDPPVRTGDAVTYSTGIGETDSIALSDGTRVMLAPASRLVVQPGYGTPRRSVTLEGEGLFDVPHDPARPFLVRAGGVEIRDLGTRFIVRADPAEVRVVVVSGSVELLDTVPRSTRRLTLKAGEASTLGSRQATPQPDRRTESDVAWVNGQLVFDNAPLSRVRDDLHRWYGIQLVIPDSALASRHVSARFLAKETRAQVLRVLELALGAAIEHRGDTAIVRPGPPPRHQDQ
jgi:transmembrane sensor